jgi:hypothetical protein
MIQEYWFMDPLLRAHQFSGLMSGDRYLLLLCLLQFVIMSNNQQVTYKLNPAIENLRKNFSDVFGPFEDTCSWVSGSLEGSTHLPKGITLE